MWCWQVLAARSFWHRAAVTPKIIATPISIQAVEADDETRLGGKARRKALMGT